MASRPGGEPSARVARHGDRPVGEVADTCLRVEVTLIRVEVTLKGTLADRVPGGRTVLELPVGAPAEAILAAVGLPVAPCVYAINGVAEKGSAPLYDGDRVVVYPPMAGG